MWTVHDHVLCPGLDRQLCSVFMPLLSLHAIILHCDTEQGKVEKGMLST